MKLLDIVFTKSKKKLPIFGWLIMWWTSVLNHGYRGFFKLWGYSHVAKGVEIRDWGKRYFQASGTQVNYEHEKFFDQKHEIVKKYTIEVYEHIDIAIKKACYQEAGNKYGIMQNLGIFLTDIYYNVFHGNTKNPWTKGRNCSEIMYANWAKVLIPDLTYDENKIKPHEIEEIILAHFVKGKDCIWRLK